MLDNIHDENHNSFLIELKNLQAKLEFQVHQINTIKKDVSFIKTPDTGPRLFRNEQSKDLRIKNPTILEMC